MKKQRNLKVGMLSMFAPEKDSVAQVYSENLLKNANHAKATYIKIGTPGSDADYKVNFKSFGLARDVKRILLKEQLEVLHIQYIAPHFGKRTFNLNVLPLLKIGIPTITTLHEVHYPQQGSLIARARRAILTGVERAIVKNSTLVNVHTPGQKDFLEEHYGVDNALNIVTGLNPKPFHERHGKNILFFGLFSPGKGIEHLLGALDMLAGCNVRIVGSIPTPACKRYHAKIRRMLDGRDFPIEVFFKLWFSEKEKAEHFGWADAGVAPYVWGPYHSGAVQDAAEYGIPVVVTRIGAIWEMVEKFRFGEVIPAKNPQAIGDGLAKVFSNYNSYRKGLSAYRNFATWEHAAAKYGEAYRDALKRFNGLNP